MYQREAVSSVLNSPARLSRTGRNAKEIMIPKISVTGLGDYTRNVGYKTGSIDFSYETKTFGYDRASCCSPTCTGGAGRTYRLRNQGRLVRLRAYWFVCYSIAYGG